MMARLEEADLAREVDQTLEPPEHIEHGEAAAAVEAEEAGGDITGTGAGEVTEVVATTWTSVRLVRCSTVHWTRCNV